jgi:purine-nucleoside phosphorylase
VAAVLLRHSVRAVHLRPAAELAERVLLPGDPQRALAVAQVLLESPRRFGGELNLELADLVAADAVLPADGASAALGADSPLRPDPALTAALVEAGARPLTVVSTDLFYDPRDGAASDWMERGASVVEMEAAAVLSVAARHGAAAACVLAVTDVPGPSGSRRLGPDELEDLGRSLGEAGYAALRSR